MMRQIILSHAGVVDAAADLACALLPLPRVGCGHVGWGGHPSPTHSFQHCHGEIQHQVGYEL